jgi:MtN3 and saliva related transmembrane protein
MPPADDLANIIGILAGCLTTLSFLPQVIKTWKSRSTRDISLTMFAAFTLGVALWLVYGLLILSWPVIVSNVVTLGLAGIILFLKVLHLKDE